MELDLQQLLLFFILCGLTPNLYVNTKIQKTDKIEIYIALAVTALGMFYLHCIVIEI